jgi:Undecaprenyl-phosphate galactose phosphotransferase WbaP
MAALNKMRAWAETLLLLCCDIASLYLAFLLSIVVRTAVLPTFYKGFPAAFPFAHYGYIGWIFLVWIFFLSYEGLYTKMFSFWDEIKVLWLAAFFSTAGIFTIVSVGKLSDSVSRTVILLMGALSVIALPLTRMLLKKMLRRLGLLKRRVLILGAGATGTLIANALKREPNYGYEVIGFLDDNAEKAGTKIDGIKVHRGVDRAVDYLRVCNITDVFIAMPGAGKERLQGLINDLHHKAERIFFVPDIFGVAVLGTNLQHFSSEEAFALELRNNLVEPLNIIFKKLFDVVVSILLLPVFFLLMAVIAIFLKFDSKGPVIFAQERIGKKGRTFKCFKFRTMHGDAEERLKGLLQKDHAAKEEYEKFWKLRNDPRVTKVGRFLRATSLDEVPQILNVIRGEMSLVGPRPVTREEINRHYGESAELCLSVLPGITGLWQVSGRSDTSYYYRIALDAWYVRNWNLWLDLVILFRTVRVVVKREGAC